VSSRASAISAFSRVYDELWRETRDPYAAAGLRRCGVWVPGFAGTTVILARLVL